MRGPRVQIDVGQSHVLFLQFMVSQGTAGFVICCPADTLSRERVRAAPALLGGVVSSTGCLKPAEPLPCGQDLNYGTCYQTARVSTARSQGAWGSVGPAANSPPGQGTLLALLQGKVHQQLGWEGAGTA